MPKKHSFGEMTADEAVQVTDHLGDIVPGSRYLNAGNTTRRPHRGMQDGPGNGSG
jgi:hypothetical protein